MWKDVVGYVGYYQVSDTGEVKRLARTFVDAKGVTQPHKEIIRKLSKNQFGYNTVRLTREHKGKGFLVHRLVGFAFIDNPDSKPFINHKDGNKQNNTVANLEWCTRSENELHAYKTGLKKMSQDGKARVSMSSRRNRTALVSRVLQLKQEGLRQIDIAGIVGYSRSYVGLILQGKKCTHTYITDV